jgi:hypothetical protein
VEEVELLRAVAVIGGLASLAAVVLAGRVVLRAGRRTYIEVTRLDASADMDFE